MNEDLSRLYTIFNHMEHKEITIQSGDSIPMPIKYKLLCAPIHILGKFTDILSYADKMQYTKTSLIKEIHLLPDVQEWLYLIDNFSTALQVPDSITHQKNPLIHYIWNQVLQNQPVANTQQTVKIQSE